MWLKVGRTNNDPRVICHYYIQTLRTLWKLPRIIRIDCGTENVMMADVHTLLRQEHHDDTAHVPVK